jgi:uncharacterized protein YndB with AHSA1/START domain
MNTVSEGTSQTDKVVTMSSSEAEIAVKKSIVVGAPIEHAFEVFTARFDSWWPREHHIGKAALEKAVLEPRTGGRYYERCVDGSECDWGTVLEFSPPNKVVLAWHLDPTWSYDPNPDHASRVEVTFTAVGDGKTRVDLVHTHIERHGAGWEKIRDGVGGAGGWGEILARFGAAAA